MRKSQCFLLIMLSALLSGCATVHQTAKDAGYPVGQGMRAVGGITEGAAEGYQYDSTSNTNNPYGR